MNSDEVSGAAAAIGEGMLKVLVGGGVIGLAILAPNAIKVLDKPLRKYLNGLDAKDRERELRRGLYYLNRRGLADKAGASYEHGLRITEKGRQRLQNAELESLAVARPASWDRKWRLVFYDIPEKHKVGRDALIRQLKRLGFYQLQRSVLVHPFPCREIVTTVTTVYEIEQYVSYIETDHIDQQNVLAKKFPFLSKNYHKLSDR